jgi:hypothetical protein
MNGPARSCFLIERAVKFFLNAPDPRETGAKVPVLFDWMSYKALPKRSIKAAGGGLLDGAVKMELMLTV